MCTTGLPVSQRDVRHDVWRINRCLPDMYFILCCSARVSQPVWASAGGDGASSAGHAEELHCTVRLCKQGHHQPPSGGPHHQPQRTRSRGTRRHPGGSESPLRQELKLKCPGKRNYLFDIWSTNTELLSRTSLKWIIINESAKSCVVVQSKCPERDVLPFTVCCPSL